MVPFEVNDMKIEGANVVVTGANRGLGRALVEAAIARGARKVYAGARDERSLAPLVAEHGARIVPLVLDVTKDATLRAAADRAADATVLVNNAGLLASYGVLDSSLAAIREDFEVNAFGTLAATRAFVPALTRAAKEGRAPAVLAVLSVASLANMPSLGGYSASKAAAWSFTQALRWELARRGIETFASYPGPIDTEMVRAIDMPKTAPRAVADAILDAAIGGELDAAPDPTGREFLGTFGRDPSALAARFAQMSG